ncbi:hypothetical protein [Blastococcus haudaquaticus]|uniref:Mce-associated membrane protein n=1 Tax=Blastococcus haudaquaticus TaxID=1938745 RepID=A0A286GF65_9ACTN|nr:hypothetical protein [Blastococcus haudaquaticus]SOD94142.1 Mce-associated membrane protein [Blastococcus haudaquaticus]
MTSAGPGESGDPQEAARSSVDGAEPTTPGTDGTGDGAAAGTEAAEASTGRRRGRRGSGDDGDGAARTGGRLSVPLVPTLLVVLLLLCGGLGYLWLTRPEASAVRTGDYVEALQAARSGVVDFTSFDYLTLDDDIEQMRRVATGDLREEGVAELDGRRDQITAAEAVVNTEVVGGGVTRAEDASATVWLVIESTQQSNASEQAQVVRYRIEVELEKSDDRWLLSGIKGTGVESE